MVSLAHQLGLSGLLPRLQVAWLRSHSPGAMIAVVGVVNRGKSTLINELMRQSISPESSRPETASILGFASDIGGRPIGLSKGGKTVRLPRFHRRFRDRVSRGSGLTAAIFGSAKHIRSGVLLVDTPGIDEAENSETVQTLADSSGAALELADAALVVLGVPGVKGTDMRLLKRALETHGTGRVLVVIKSNDSSVMKQDLEMWQEELNLASSSQSVALVSDQDKSDLRKIHSFIDQIWNSSRTSSDRRVGETVSALCLEIDAVKTISVSRRLLRRLPKQIADLVAAKSPREVRKREEQERRRQKQLEEERVAKLRVDFEKIEAAWMSRQQSLVSAAHSAELAVAMRRDNLRSVVEVNGRITSRVSAFFSQSAQSQQELAFGQATEALKQAEAAFRERRRERDKHANTRPVWLDYLKKNS